MGHMRVVRDLPAQHGQQPSKRDTSQNNFLREIGAEDSSKRVRATPSVVGIERDCH